MTAPSPPVVPRPPPVARELDAGHWWALLLRRICLLIVGEVERRYGIEGKHDVR